MANRVERRDFCKVMAGLPLLATAAGRSGATEPGRAQEQGQAAVATAQFVGAGEDRTHTPVAMGFSSLGFKVSGQETHGAVFLMEHVGLTKGGGPLRHLHHGQEEWFYVIEGEVVAEVGEERFRLKVGDSIFAPRKVPHAFVYVAEKPGRLLIAFTPAGKMEAYFRNGHGYDAKSFAEYEMELVGPGLTLEEAARV
jgi:quercetin dioxygenase-like cupin family protein